MTRLNLIRFFNQNKWLGILRRIPCGLNLRLRLSVPFLCFFLLSACSGGADAAFKDYQQRLERLLEQAAPTAPQANPQTIPTISSQRLDVARVSLSLLDSMRLNHCTLGQLVAERNSSLGKVRSPSALLFYELQIIPALRTCIAQGNLSTDLASQLESALAQKQAQRSTVIHNFLTTDEHIRALLRPSVANLNAPLSDSDMESIFSAAQALAAILDALDKPEQLNEEQWLHHIRVLGQHSSQRAHWGSYWQTLNHSVAKLDQLTGLLQQAQSLNCREGQPNQTARYLSNVLLGPYTDTIQATMAQLDQLGRTLAPLLQRMSAYSETESWRSYLQYLEAQIYEIPRASQQHAEAWQQLLAPCGLMPQ
ncbi:DUF3080 family protein [Aliidiomarina celeris]|uniref:DUF3080 family protein n=1 Tax=Aliidiomarina celeris TaxID=2249428 RepID=UPI00130023E9|nr:DUF3080 family protein [Aliidiomarina celeris]